MFYIGNENEPHTITLANYTGTDQEVFPYFYCLDQEIFETVIEELQNKEMQLERFEDGYVRGSYNADEKGWMLLTIPYAGDWEAYINGERVEILGGANALTVIPIGEGENQIELEYYIPGVREGLIMTLAGICVFMVLRRIFFKRKS